MNRADIRRWKYRSRAGTGPAGSGHRWGSPRRSRRGRRLCRTPPGSVCRRDTLRPLRRRHQVASRAASRMPRGCLRGRHRESAAQAGRCLRYSAPLRRSPCLRYRSPKRSCLHMRRARHSGVPGAEGRPKGGGLGNGVPWWPARWCRCMDAQVGPFDRRYRFLRRLSKPHAGHLRARWEQMGSGCFVRKSLERPTSAPRREASEVNTYRISSHPSPGRRMGGHVCSFRTFRGQNGLRGGGL